MRKKQYLLLAATLVTLGGSLVAGGMAAANFATRLAKLAAAQPGARASREILLNEGYYGTELALTIALASVSVVSFVTFVACCLLYLRQPIAIVAGGQRPQRATRQPVIEGATDV